MAELTKQENQLRAEKIEVDEKLKAATKSINEDKVNVHQWKAKVSENYNFYQRNVRISGILFAIVRCFVFFC